MRSESNSERMGIRASKDSKDFLLEFDTTSEDFMRGFECGEIWACLADGVEEIRAIVTADNAEMIIRMAEAADYSYQGKELTDDEAAELDLGLGEWMIVVMYSKDIHE